MIKTWQRYLFQKLFALFSLFIFLLFCLFCILDFSISGLGFYIQNNPSAIDLCKYYGFQFSSLFNILCPFAFLLATIKTLLDLNFSGELVVLQMTGLKTTKILYPLFFFASLLIVIHYSNQEWIVPRSEELCKLVKKKTRTSEKLQAHKISLNDGSSLLYAYQERHQFFDVFWIQTDQTIWHMKFLDVDPSKAIKTGKFVDEFIINENGALQRLHSYDEKDVSNIPLDMDKNQINNIAIEKQPLSNHFAKLFFSSPMQNLHLTYLQYKLSLPLIHYMIILTIAPFALRFSRNKKSFLITCGALVFFLSFITIQEGMLILAEHLICPSYLAIWGPQIIVYFFIAILFSFFKKNNAPKVNNLKVST